MKNNVARRWANALRSGKYRKTTGSLKRTDGSYCALGVLCDLYKKQGGPLGEKPIPHKDIWWVVGGGSTLDEEGAILLGGESQIPPKKVLNWAGLGIIQAEEIAGMNDDGHSFRKIATHIDKNKEIL
jgi:hypothetical protein